MDSVLANEVELVTPLGPEDTERVLARCCACVPLPILPDSGYGLFFFKGRFLANVFSRFPEPELLPSLE